MPGLHTVSWETWNSSSKACGQCVIVLMLQQLIFHSLLQHLTCHPLYSGKGSEIGDYLTQHPAVDCISFTGGNTGISVSKKVSSRLAALLLHVTPAPHSHPEPAVYSSSKQKTSVPSICSLCTSSSTQQHCLSDCMERHISKSTCTTACCTPSIHSQLRHFWPKRQC